MKRSEARKRLQALQHSQEVDNFASNLNRARSITVGTAFGGTTEIMMRSDGGRHIWCVMQPVEVIELIHQLSANVGCNAQLTPRKDFASWRDWRVSEAEKKHLNGFAPFVNDMAVYQKLGASGFNDEEAQKIMDILASQTSFVNENDDSKIVGKDKNKDGAPALMVGEEDGLLHNKLAMVEDRILYVAGGNGGHNTVKDALDDALEAIQKNGVNDEHTMATEKTVNRRKPKRAAASS